MRHDSRALIFGVSIALLSVLVAVPVAAEGFRNRALRRTETGRCRMTCRPTVSICPKNSGTLRLAAPDKVEWVGDWLGLSPRLNGRAPWEIVESPRSMTGSLLKQLRCKDSFAAAHIRLTKMYGATAQLNAASWNGLEVELFGDGSYRYPLGAQQAMIRYWEARLIGVIRCRPK